VFPHRLAVEQLIAPDVFASQHELDITVARQSKCADELPLLLRLHLLLHLHRITHWENDLQPQMEEPTRGLDVTVQRIDYLRISREALLHVDHYKG
jgi:hypothetical protein